MHSPVLAAVFLTAPVLFLGWWIAMMKFDPPSPFEYLSFLAWALPLFYIGGFAAGYSWGDLTLTFVGLCIVWLIAEVRWRLQSAMIDRAQRNAEKWAQRKNEFP